MQADYRIGIVGAGFAGLVAALRLKKEGIDSFIIFEKGQQIGGTWRDNIYPGCACDVAVHLYSFAGNANPNWNKLYASQSDILAYLKQVVADRDLQKHIRLATPVVAAHFLQEQGVWQVHDRAGNTTTVQVLLLGLGSAEPPGHTCDKRQSFV